MLGNNLEKLKELEDNSIDSIVTDPPYGLSFMNKKWDYDVPSVEFWKEVLRVLKPGGHLLSFGGTRTYHRMTVNIEDAGFEIRDCIQWLYGSGFPKSHNIGKAIDKLEGNEREVIGDNPNHRKTSGLLELGFQDGKEKSPITKGNTEWEGWGTALKPANEPIVLARKPLEENTVAENVLKYRTGGINIDESRIGTDDEGRYNWNNGDDTVMMGGEGHSSGRFPANIILDEVAAEELDKQNNASRFFYIAKVSKKERSMGLKPIEVFSQRPRRQDGSIIYKEKDYDEWVEAMSKLPRKDKTSLAASEEKLQIQKTSLKNTHPTVKPISLMYYLCKLITPPNGTILDPYMGSGSTGIASQLGGFNFVGMEMEEEYFNIAQSRINHYEEYRRFLKK